MKHPNAQLLESFYSALIEKDVTSMMTHFSDTTTFQVPGKSKLAGKYTKTNYQNLVTKMSELSNGTVTLEVHDVFANDHHGMVLLTTSLKREGAVVQLRSSQVWRFEKGQPVAGYEYARDLYQYDAIWS